MHRFTYCLFVIGLLLANALRGGEYLELRYAPSSQPGELVYGVKFTLWIPEGVKSLRGVIVHQHGCGSGACKSGGSAAYDLQWQALARKWDCALLGPSYEQEDQQDCRQWCDPRNGSARAFLNALRDFSVKSGHPELERVPWCLWGHSGGGFWSSLMQTLYPERIVAIWLRSGTAFYAWDAGEIPLPNLSAESMAVPVMSNPGLKEQDDKRFSRIWSGSVQMVQQYRQRGGLIGFAPDPFSGHDCRMSRSLAIRFFDACLALRLPEAGGDPGVLKKITEAHGWYGRMMSDQATSRANFDGDVREGVWLPSEEFAKAWSEYVRTGTVKDETPPDPPENVTLSKTDEGKIRLTWNAESDLESGIQGFEILREGELVGKVVPEEMSVLKINQWQMLSFHDTPTRSEPEMVWVEAEPSANSAGGKFQVVTINGDGLSSAASEEAVFLK